MKRVFSGIVRLLIIFLQILFWFGMFAFLFSVPYCTVHLTTIGADSLARGLGKVSEANDCQTPADMHYPTSMNELRAIAHLFSGLDKLECLVRVNAAAIGEVMKFQVERKEKIFGYF